MKFSYNCPACNKKIGLLSHALAITPFFIRCRHCSSSLKATNVTFLVLLSTILIGAPMVHYTFQYVANHGKITAETLLLIMLFVFAIEIVASIIICSKATIKIRKNRFQDK